MANTPNLGLIKPIVGADDDAWGDMLNANSDAIDSQVAKIDSQAFTGTPDLPTGTTAVTQTAGDASTKLATTAFVKAQSYLTNITLSGDITGSGTSVIAATVAKLQGRPLIATAPTSGQLLGYDGTSWRPVAAGAVSAGGTNGQIQYNNGGLLGGITQNGSGNVVMTTGSAGVSHLNDVAVTGANPAVVLNKTASGGANVINGCTGSLQRWSMQLGTNAAESTGNAGSNFTIARYDDAGTFVDNAFQIFRGSGNALFSDTVTADLFIASGSATANPSLTLDKPAGKDSFVLGKNGGSMRWAMSLGNSVAETGSNVGSDFTVSRYSDAGAGIDTPFSITRSTGKANFSLGMSTGPVVVNSGALGTVAGSSVLGLTVSATNANVDHLRTEMLRAADGTDWNSAKWQIYRQVGSTKMGYVEFDSTTYKPIAFGKNATEYAYFDGGGKLFHNNTVTITSAVPAINLNKTAVGQFPGINGQLNGVTRWAMTFGNSSAESGSNAGSNFALTSYSDAGAQLGSPIFVHRASGYTYLNGHGATAISATYETAPFGHSALRLNKAGSGKTNAISGHSNGLMRWSMEFGDSVAESTGNVGSSFALARFNDAGTYIDTPLSISRSTGAVVFMSSVQAAGYVNKQGVSGATNTSSFNFYWTGSALQAWVDATNLGNVTIASDYRIKKDIAPLPSMWGRVKTLNPIRYEHKDWTPEWVTPKEGEDAPAPLITGDGKERWGFIAHELQEALIEDAATGQKDEQGLIQSPNPWTVIATLTKALQEAMARIEALEARK